MDSSGVQSILIWSGVLIALVLVAFGAYSWLKRWMNDTGETNRGVGFTLSDLRELHRQGKMSTEEFELTRSKMVAAAKKMAASMPDVLPRRQGVVEAGEPDPPAVPPAAPR